MNVERNVEHAISERRREIDAVDDELLRLLNRRAELASRLLRLKRDAGLAVHDPDRERDVVRRTRGANAGPLDGAAVEAIFRCIVTEVRKNEEAENRRMTASGDAPQG